MGWYRFHSRREADRRREEEMSSHIGLYVEEAMARGRSEDTARREARLKFGNPRAKREAVDDLSRIPFVESFIADLRTAVRSLRAAPGFTITVLVVLTLAMGATTAVFSIVDAVVLRPMPFDRQERIVVLGHLFQDHWTTSPLAAPQFLALRSQPDLFESLAAVTDGGISLRRDGARDAEILRGQRVTADFFKVLRIAPALGRAFGQDDEADGRDRVVVISAALWQRRFDRDPAIVGRSLAGADGAW